MMYTWHYLSPVGDLTMTGTESALTSLYFSSQKHLPDLLDDELIKRETEIFTGEFYKLNFKNLVTKRN